MQDEPSQNATEEDDRTQKAVMGLLLRRAISGRGRWRRLSARWGTPLWSPTPLLRCLRPG